MFNRFQICPKLVIAGWRNLLHVRLLPVSSDLLVRCLVKKPDATQKGIQLGPNQCFGWGIYSCVHQDKNAELLFQGDQEQRSGDPPSLCGVELEVICQLPGASHHSPPASPVATRCRGFPFPAGPILNRLLRWPWPPQARPDPALLANRWQRIHRCGAPVPPPSGWDRGRVQPTCRHGSWDPGECASGRFHVVRRVRQG